MANEQGDVHVIYDYQNVIYIDPNKVITNTGEVIDRAVIPEDFVMYANLETKLIPRTKLLVGGAIDNSISNVSIGSINFLKPNTGDDYFTSGYYDEITGKDSLTKDGGANQSRSKQVKENNETYTLDYATNVADNTLFGIKSIAIRTNSSFVPTVTVVMEDVQGRALFSLGNDSPYAAFFNLPYPPFYLTIKGYYGKAVRYELVLLKFNASYNTNNGDYTVTLDFLGFKYNVLSDISVGHLIACPNMYSKKYNVTQKNPYNLTPSQINNIVNHLDGVTQSSLGDEKVFEVNTEIGYQKIIEVYKDYKSKELIDANFPELTLSELIYKLEMFEQNVLNSLNKVDVQKLTDGKRYKKFLTNYYQEIRGNLRSWFNKYLDPTPIRLNNTDDVIFGVKKELIDNIKDGKLFLVESDLKTIISKYTTELNDNPTFGIYGTSPIQNNINYDLFNVVNADIDWCTTYKSKNKSISISEIPTLTEDICRSRIENNIFYTYTLSGETKTTPVFNVTRFIDERNLMESKFINELNGIEQALSQELALKIEKKETGIGFKPTIKNVIAVIMATTEGFLRLMEDVHNSAWNVRSDVDRKNAVLGSDKISVDDNSNTPNVDQFVFPWPTVYYTNDKKNANKYELIYPGDPTVVNVTKGYYYDKWPEVEFVEEYINGYSKRLEVPSPSDILDSDKIIRDSYVPNTIEYPFTTLPYELTSNVKFLYELWDRLILSSYNSGFSAIYAKDKRIGFLIKENEFKNISNTLKTNSIIFIQQLKNILFSEGGLDYNNYGELLQSLSSGVSERYNKYLDGTPNSKYIIDILDAPSKISDINDFKLATDNFSNNLSEGTIKTITDAIQKAPIEGNINFTYPFTDVTWVDENLINTFPNKFDTKNTILFNTKRNVITNFNDYNQAVINRPFKFFASQGGATYGQIFQENFSSNQLRGLINTPIFTNAIQLGVSKWRAGEKHPYIASAYLFLNSLPLSPLTNFFITRGQREKNGHVFATFIKYSALHKLPYAWILKYGSIWHRYKNYVKTGDDFLDDVWKDFDYKSNYNIDSNFQYIVNENQTINLKSGNNVDVGFYPVMMNDYNAFLNGYDLFSGFTNNELIANQKRGLKVIKSFEFPKSGLTFNCYTTLVPKNIYDSSMFSDYCEDVDFSLTSKYYILPSTNNNIPNNNLFQTSSYNYDSLDDLLNVAHNGAVNVTMQDTFNSFTFKDLKKPLPTEYLNSKKDINSFSLLNSGGADYASIEDMFSVFDYDTLNLFENEFLDFSKSIYDINENKDQINLVGLEFGNPVAAYRNFQLLYRNLMEIPSNYLNLNNLDLYNKSAKYQIQNIREFLDAFLSYDVLFKYGNPTQYDRYEYNSLISHLGGNSTIQNPKRFKGYVANSLPNNISLQASELSNAPAWETLKLHIGFSTIESLKYKNGGSYITDFFIDNNIQFTSENIIALAKPIKIYATQKLKNPNITKQEFLVLLDNNQKALDTFLKDNVNQTLSLLKREINNIDIVEINQITSGLDSKFSKYDLYETFKSINDKWISGSDYTSRTLFEDVLFLDRGNRNIGDLYYVDIFDLKKIFVGAKTNVKTPVFNFIGGILVKNNFNVLPMPSYVNFYGALSAADNIDDIIQNSTEIANDVWGNYSDVDYRKSGPKLVCMYSGRGSTTPSGPKDFRYGDDAIDMLKPSKIPFLEDQAGKKDWSQSNKCVSFLVDAGIRNQAIFYGIQVDQNSGTATLESLTQQEALRNNVSNREVTTQSVSLFNLYKNLSYKSTINCLGNALIQPTMYFNLEHVPMFGGPYFITEVSHNIAPGSFETTFTGVRQSIYSPPSTDTYLTSINENLLTKIESNYSKSIVNEKDEKATATNSTQTSDSKQTNSSVCGKYLYADYANYDQTTEELITYSSATQIHAAINSLVPDKKMADNIYLITYLASYDKDGFKANHNNFGNVWLTYNRGDISLYNAPDQLFYCAISVENKKIQTPFAIFKSFELYVQFMQSALTDFSILFSGLEGSSSFTELYITVWLYGQNFSNDANLGARVNYERLSKENFYAKLDKKFADANASLKALTPPAEVTESQKELYVSARNKSEKTKLSKVCEYTYNNIKVIRTPAEPEYTLPYSLDMFFEAKNPKELLYLDAMTKTIEDTLVRLYILDSAPKVVVSSFDIKVKSADTYSISVSLKIDKGSNNLPFTGFKFLAESGGTVVDKFFITNNMFESLIKSNPNYSSNNEKKEDNDTIGDIISYEDNLLNIKYIGANYTKLILYPKLN